MIERLGMCGGWVAPMADIQERDRMYDFLRPLADKMFQLSYRRIQYVGKENIPSDGAVIFAPNHTNAICDAIAILSINRERKVFVARADIFKNKKAAALLTWFKIMPMKRIRDGVQEVLHNDETEQKAIDTLRDGVKFCILPEGTHRPKHSLLPLGKGIFRIALRANEEFGHEKPIYIVPVGLEYGDHFHLWDHLTVNIGKPINITEFVAKAKQDWLAEKGVEITQPQLILQMREELTLRMREQIMWVPDDENYEANWKQLRDNPPAPFDRFKKHYLPKWLVICLAVLLLPLFIVSAAVTVPLWVAVLVIRHVVKDPAFRNSIQFLWQFVMIPLTLFVRLPFWMFFQEYIYQLRSLK